MGALAQAESRSNKELNLKDLRGERNIDSIQIENELVPKEAESSGKKDYFRTPAAQRRMDFDVSSLRNQYNLMRDQSNLIQSW